MMQVSQIQVLDTVDGSSMLEIREAFQHVSNYQNATMYEVRVFEDLNRKTLVAFSPKDDDARTIGVRGPVVLSAMEVKDIVAHSKQKDKLHAGHLPVLFSALPVFEQRKMNLADYQITLLRDKNSYFVTFTDRDSKSGGRGNVGKRLGFEIEISVADMHVVNSHFIR